MHNSLTIFVPSDTKHACVCNHLVYAVIWAKTTTINLNNVKTWLKTLFKITLMRLFTLCGAFGSGELKIVFLDWGGHYKIVTKYFLSDETTLTLHFTCLLVDNLKTHPATDGGMLGNSQWRHVHWEHSFFQQKYIPSFKNSVNLESELASSGSTLFLSTKLVLDDDIGNEIALLYRQVGNNLNSSKNSLCMLIGAWTFIHNFSWK